MVLRPPSPGWGFLNAAAFDGDLFVHRDNLLLEPPSQRALLRHNVDVTTQNALFLGIKWHLEWLGQFGRLGTPFFLRIPDFQGLERRLALMGSQSFGRCHFVLDIHLGSVRFLFGGVKVQWWFRRGPNWNKAWREYPFLSKDIQESLNAFETDPAKLFGRGSHVCGTI